MVTLSGNSDLEEGFKTRREGQEANCLIGEDNRMVIAEGQELEAAGSL